MALQIANRTTKRKRVISEMPSINFNLASCILAVLSSHVVFTSESERKERNAVGKSDCVQQVFLAEEGSQCNWRDAFATQSLHCTLPSTFVQCQGEGYRPLPMDKDSQLIFLTFPLHSNLGGADPHSIFQDHRSLWICPWHIASKWQNLVSNPGDQMLKHVSVFLLV